MSDKNIIHSVSTIAAFDHLLGQFQTVRIEIDENFTSILKNGSFSVVAPSSVSQQRIADLSTGGLLSPNVGYVEDGFRIRQTPDTNSETAIILSKFLAKIENPVIYATEPLDTEKCAIAGDWTSLKIDKTVYAVCRNNLENPAVIANILGSFSLSWHFLAVICSLKMDPSSNSELLNHAKMLVIGAYDGESYLFWLPKHDFISM